MNDSQAAEGAFARHRENCVVCRISGYAWERCPVGSQLMETWLKVNADEEKATRRTTEHWFQFGWNKTPALVLAAIGVFGLALYFENSRSEDEHRTKPQARRAISNADRSRTKTFAGYNCTVDCSGHKAGYKWAEDNDISDGEHCDRAGERSSSPSFAEGCHAYVDGEPDPEAAADPDNEN